MLASDLEMLCNTQKHSPEHGEEELPVSFPAKGISLTSFRSTQTVKMTRVIPAKTCWQSHRSFITLCQSFTPAFLSVCISAMSSP